jgi:Flp pilus assembly protein TadG
MPLPADSKRTAPSPSPRRRRPASRGALFARRGTVLVLTVLLMISMIGVLAFALDLGYIVHVRTELQRTADASALAAASLLPDVAAATDIAHATADNNGWSPGVKIGEGDETHGADFDPMKVEFGYWDRDDATFTMPPPYGRNTNAVRVTLTRSEEGGNPIRLFFGRVLGTDNTDVAATATAIYDRWLCGPFVGIEWLSVPGSPGTDSYDTKKGHYQQQPAKNRGSVCSDGPIIIDGTPVIRGDARAGEGYDVSLYGNPTVTGSIGSRLEKLNLPPVDASVAAVDNDNDQIPMIPEGNSWVSPVDSEGNFLLDGTKVIDMPPGTYYFNDFTVEGQSTFNIHGPTTIYVTGNLRRAGGTVVNNSTQLPENLTFLMTGGTASVTSDNAFHGVIYAPNTDVTIDGDSDIYGAVVGKTLTVTGSGSGHYDESLDLEQVEFPRRVALVD